MFSRSLLAKGLGRRVNSRLIRVWNKAGSLESPNPKSTNPKKVVLLFKEVPGLLFCESFWLLFFNLDFIMLLRDNLCRVLRLLREPLVMVFLSFQIKRDMEVCECFCLLKTFPPDLVSTVQGGCISASGTVPARSRKRSQHGLSLGYSRD